MLTKYKTTDKYQPELAQVDTPNPKLQIKPFGSAIYIAGKFDS
jgi:hypothetical protein